MLKDTIISAFNYDGTLLKWLKKVEDALKNASASEFRVNKKGNATISFSIVFANGDTLESGDIILQQGESVTNATIRQGHLILTLSNGDELDAGDLGGVTGFSINDSQHLIVAYQNGTTQDLGAIFTGATINVDTLTSNNAEISTLKPVVEVMEGYSISPLTTLGVELDIKYAGAVKNGNKLTLSIAGKLTFDNYTGRTISICLFRIPTSIGLKLFPLTYDRIDVKRALLTDVNWDGIDLIALLNKDNNTQLGLYFRNSSDINSGTYDFRYEVTFLLSENLAQ